MKERLDIVSWGMKVNQYGYGDDNKVSLKLTVYKDGDGMLNRSNVRVRRGKNATFVNCWQWAGRLKVIMAGQNCIVLKKELLKTFMSSP